MIFLNKYKIEYKLQKKNFKYFGHFEAIIIQFFIAPEIYQSLITSTYSETNY